MADHLREDRRRARPGPDHLLRTGVVHRVDTRQQALLDERALLRAAAHLALLLPAAAAADDQLVGFLVLAARALAERRHAPRGDRMPAALRLALAAAVRVVDGVHRGTAHRRTLALPAAAPRLADGDVLVVDVADLTDRRAAGERHPAQLAGWQPKHSEPLVLRDELDPGAGASRELAALAGLQLDVVHERARRDALERERVPGFDVGAGAGLDRRADLQPSRSEDVGLRPVGVVEERDAGRAVGVVLDRSHLRRHTVLDALEVDLAVAALVPAALVAPGDAAVRVAATALLQRLDQALLRLALRDLVERRDRHEAAAGRRRLVLADGHQETWAPSKISIDSPSRTCTMAFFQPGLVPRIRPRRFGFGWTLRMFTRWTCTPKSSSTAWRI